MSKCVRTYVTAILVAAAFSWARPRTAAFLCLVAVLSLAYINTRSQPCPVYLTLGR